MVRIAGCLVVLMLSGSTAFGQASWFPVEWEQAAANQLLKRLAEIGVEPTASPSEQQVGARQAIRELTGRIDGWGMEGVVARTPALPEIGLPELGDRTVTTIARLGMCAVVLHPELVETTDEKIYVAMGELAVPILSAFLRDRFLAAGGTDEQLAASLASERMNQLSYDVQMDEEKRNYVAAECGPMFQALFQ